ITGALGRHIGTARPVATPKATVLAARGGWRDGWRIIDAPRFSFASMASPLDVVILAAGLGKRMHSALPKVLHPLAGRPLAAHVVDTVRTLSPRAIVVVVGNGADRVAEALAAPDVVFARQEPPLGTGDATRVALAAMPGN